MISQPIFSDTRYVHFLLMKGFPSKRQSLLPELGNFLRPNNLTLYWLLNIHVFIPYPQQAQQPRKCGYVYNRELFKLNVSTKHDKPTKYCDNMTSNEQIIALQSVILSFEYLKNFSARFPGGIKRTNFRRALRN